MSTFRNRMPRRGPLTRAGVAVIAAATVGLGGCVRGPQPPPTWRPAPPATTTTAPTPSLPRPPSGGDGATGPVQAYRGIWDAYVAASRFPDPHHPDLAVYAHGEALRVFVDGLTRMRRDGLVGEGDVVLHPRVVAVNPHASPPTVDIADCVDTSATRLVAKDGPPYESLPGGRHRVLATVTRTAAGTWKVTSFALSGVGSC